jgi:type II secretory pathway pseudopilin PulG
MESHFLKMIMQRRGFSLIEMGMSLFLTVILMGGALSAGHTWIEESRQKKVWRTLKAMLEISRQYAAEKGIVPVAIEELNTFDPRVPLAGPWGDPYVIVASVFLWCVETRVPPHSGNVYQGGAGASVIAEEKGDILRVCRPIGAHE